MQITYKDKVTLQSNSNIPDENKVTAEDMNEIKSVVNSNEEEQQALTLSVQEIAQNVVNNSQEISNIKEEQTTQNENIQSNSNNISDLQLNKADKTEIPTDLSQLSNDNTKFVNETELENAIFQEKTQRQNADNNLQNQVDTNKTNIQTNATNIATNTQEINRIKAEQTTQNNRLNNLETDNTTNKSNISSNTQEINNIKSEQTTQNTNIQTNADNISALTSRVTETEEDISDIKQEQTEQNTNISTNATNIESLQEENESLKKIVSQLPQVTGQGTEVTLENTIEAQFTKFDVEGNSKQETTEGRQLLKYPYVATTTTVNGVTFTDNGDGSLKINGTASEEARFNLQWDNKVPAGSYSYIVFNLPNNCFANYYTIGNKYGEDVGNRTSDTEINLGSSIVVPAGVTVSNVTVYPMLVSGTYTRETIPNWEKYTNGASPNPNYEQPIYSAGDNENLFDGELELGTLGSTGANNNSTTDIRSKNYVTVDEQETYTISSDKGTSASLRFYDANKTFISTLTGASMPRTFEIPENAKYVRFVIPNTTDINAKVKLEKGNKASGYSPYGMGSINEKILTRNLVDGVLDNSSSTTAKLITKNMNVLVPAGTYTISFTNKPGQSNANIYSGSTNILNIPWYSDKKTFTLTEPTLITRITCDVGANQIVYAQLEPGSTATQYVPHKEQDYSIFVQQPFRSIGDVRDLFFKNTVDSPYYDENLTLNGWYERHYIGEKILNGTENWEIYNTHIYLYDNTFKASVESNDYVPNYKCNYFIPDSLFNANTSPNGKILQNVWGVLAKHKGIAFNSQDTFSDVATLKTWLSTHNVVVQYELETPLDLPCTSEQVEQLENKPSTYKDFTIIQSQDETEAYLEVSGIRDINTMFDKVTNAIVSLGGNV